MKLVAGHQYLRGPGGEVVPYSEQLMKASKYEAFVQQESFENELQLPENQKIIARKPIPTRQVDVEEVKQAKQPMKSAPVPTKPQTQPAKKFEHMDIRKEMAEDLKGATNLDALE